MDVRGEVGAPDEATPQWRVHPLASAPAEPPDLSTGLRRVRWDLAVRADLDEALLQVKSALDQATFPFDLPSAPPARDLAARLAAQLDDYLIPRLRRIDAPLLAVVGGSTGAGKSTLVNSLVRAPVSTAGAIRPTTRGPVLVCHQADGVWFNERSLLSSLARSTRPGDNVLQVVVAPNLRPGLALLDAPDIDSVVAANRALAHELMAAADLWLFVTTAVRYADAVPWAVLREARDRGTAVALVLDRVPSASIRDEIAADFARMLTDQRLGDAPLFVVTESTLDGHGLLAELEVAPIKRWLDTVANSATERRGVTRRTLLGAVGAAGRRMEELAAAADEQVRAAALLTGAVRESYGQAMSDVERRLRAGALLRGEIFVRWQELMDTGELEHALRALDRPRAGRTRVSKVERPAPGRRFLAELHSALASLVSEVDLAATERIRARWRADPAGRELLATDRTLARPWPGFADAAHDLVHNWHNDLRTLARSEAPRLRTATRSYQTASTVLLSSIAAVAPAPEAITAAGPAAQVLGLVLDNRAARSIGDRARADFLVRVGELLAVEVQRHLRAISAVAVNPALAPTVRDGAARLGVARSAFATLDAA